MSKEILLYNPIYSSTAAGFIQTMEDNKDNDITVRMNCPGGEVYAAYGMYAKFKEHAKGKKVKVDGMAKSGGFFFCVYADNVECLDVSDFMAHRAALPSYIESDPEMFTDEVKAQLNKINSSLREGVESKIDPAVFQSITGVSLDDMFSLDSRIDVNITAAQAKEMGLVNKITPLTAKAKAQILALSASHGVAAFSTEPTIIETSNNTIMNAAEFKAANPAAYAEIVAEGAAAEKTRVAMWMVYNDVDPKAVAEGIKSGNALDPVAQVEFGRKLFASQGLAAVTADAAAPITTTVVEGDATPEAAITAAFNAEVKNNLSKISII